MDRWHTCNTEHCRAGWVVTLAGEEGKKLEEQTSTLFAAMQIYKASSPIRVSPNRFFEDNETAMKDIKRCAEEEKHLIISSNILFSGMNEKEKAEAYVRSKCPELMELSFGCLLKNKYTQLDCDTLNVLVEKAGKDIMAYRPSFKVCGLFPTGTFDIIGHQPQLQHWLRVLPKYRLEISATAYFLYIEYTGTDHKMSFDLTTGQPTTEADYKAFNQIAGI